MDMGTEKDFLEGSLWIIPQWALIWP
jgi:hypothetical protein